MLSASTVSGNFTATGRNPSLGVSMETMKIVKAMQVLKEVNTDAHLLGGNDGTGRPFLRRPIS